MIKESKRQSFGINLWATLTLSERLQKIKSRISDYPIMVFEGNDFGRVIEFSRSLMNDNGRFLVVKNGRKYAVYRAVLLTDCDISHNEFKRKFESPPRFGSWIVEVKGKRNFVLYDEKYQDQVNGLNRYSER